MTHQQIQKYYEEAPALANGIIRHQIFPKHIFSDKLFSDCWLPTVILCWFLRLSECLKVCKHYFGQVGNQDSDLVEWDNPIRIMEKMVLVIRIWVME